MRLLGNDPDHGAAAPDEDVPAYPALDYTIDETGRYVDVPTETLSPDPLTVDGGIEESVTPDVGASGEPVSREQAPDPEPAVSPDPDTAPPLLDDHDHTGDWGFADDPVTPEAVSLSQFGWDSEPEPAAAEAEAPAWGAAPDLFEPPRAPAEDTSSLPWFLHDEPPADEAPADPAPTTDSDVPPPFAGAPEDLLEPAPWSVGPESVEPPPVGDDEVSDPPEPVEWAVAAVDDGGDTPGVSEDSADPLADEVPTAASGPQLVDDVVASVPAVSDQVPPPDDQDPPAADPWFLPPTDAVAAAPEIHAASPDDGTATDQAPTTQSPAAPIVSAPQAEPTIAAVPLEPAPSGKRGKKDPPSPADITSVGVAILPGVPLPDWVTPPPAEVAQWQGADQPLATLPDAPAETVVASADHAVPVAAAAAVGTALPPPDPAHWSEHPWGPVVWGDAAPAAVAVATAAPVALPVAPVEPLAPPPPEGSGVNVTPEPAVSAGPEPSGSAAPADEFGWLYQPDDSSPPPVPSVEPGPPPPLADTEVGQNVDVMPAPVGAPIVVDDAPPSPGDVALLAAAPGAPAAAPSTPPAPVVPAPPTAPPQETVARPDAAGATPQSPGDTGEPPLADDPQPDPAGRPRTSGALKWILIIGGLLIVVAAAAFAAFVTPGFLTSAGPPAPPTLVTPAQAAGLTRTSKPAEPAAGTFTAVAAAEQATGSEMATYSGDGVVATVWVASDSAATPDSLAGAYRGAGGAPVKEWVTAPAGPRGGSMKCGAVSASQSVCVWAGNGVVGASDITGSGRSEAATLTGKMRVALEQSAAA